MENKQQQLLYKILRNFEGMTKLDAFDLLHKLEVLLFYIKTPFDHTQIKNIILSNTKTDNNIDLFQYTILPNGNFCDHIGSNDWVHVYKEVRQGIDRLCPMSRYYYKTKYEPLKLLRLNSKNLLNSVIGTDREQSVFTFLDSHRITKKNQNTNQLLLLSNVL